MMNKERFIYYICPISLTGMLSKEEYLTIDWVALGELLIDFIPVSASEAGNQRFEQNPGGAPANVLAAIAKLGKKGAYIGMVGNDQFGVFLKDVPQRNKIDTRGLKFSTLSIQL